MKSVDDRTRWGIVASCALLLAAQACTSEEARTRSEAEGARAPAAESASAVGSVRTTSADPSGRFQSPVRPIESMSAAELLESMERPEGPIVLDVRTPEEYAAAHVPGAINVPYDQVVQQLDSLERFRARGLVVYCRSGKRAGHAERVLQDAGFQRLWDLDGHMLSWEANGLPREGTCC